MFEIKIEDIKSNTVIIDGVDKCSIAKKLLMPPVQDFFDIWSKQKPSIDGLLDTLVIEYLDLRYVFFDHYWD